MNQERVTNTLESNLGDQLPVLLYLGAFLLIAAVGLNAARYSISSPLVILNAISCSIFFAGALLLQNLRTSANVNHWICYGYIFLMFINIVFKLLAHEALGLELFFMCVLPGLVLPDAKKFWLLLAPIVLTVLVVSWFYPQFSILTLFSILVGIPFGYLVLSVRRDYAARGLGAADESDSQKKILTTEIAQLTTVIQQKDQALARVKLPLDSYQSLIYSAPVPMLIHRNGVIHYTNGPLSELFLKRERLLQYEPVSSYINTNLAWLNTDNLPTSLSLINTAQPIIAANFGFDNDGHFLLTIHAKESLSIEFDESSVDKSSLASDSLKVMIAEDNPVNMEVVCGLVERLGHIIVGRAVNGQELLSSIGAVSPDVVLMDISMPVLDGLETIKQLREQPAYKTLFVAAVTAHADSASRNQALLAGFDAFVTKPIFLDDLNSVLEQFVLDNEGDLEKS